MFRCIRVVLLFVPLWLPSYNSMAETKQISEVAASHLSCNKCIELGFGAKDNGCPQCLPPFLGIKPENSSCKKWTEDRQAGGQASDRDVYWLFGFISGYNVYAPGTLQHPKPFFFNYDEQNILKEIDRSCAASPRESVVKVVIDFLNSMRKSQHN